jgi:hypothetical protein
MHSTVGHPLILDISHPSVILTGQPAFPIDLTELRMALRVDVNNEPPDIPDDILLSTRKFITDCWAREPGERPSFKEIVDRMMEMKFKVILNVYSSKLVGFVTKIEEWEAHQMSSML